jgi:Ca2+-binding RTX toxin-like protein
MTYTNASEITSLYLYGQMSGPADPLSSTVISPKIVAGQPGRTFVEYDATDFMTNGPGRFALGCLSSIVDRFFNPQPGDPTIPPKPGGYTKAELNQFYNLTYYGIDIQQYDYDDGKGDYAERVYLWNSGAFKISDEARFVVTGTGERYITNFAVVPLADDFDLDSNDFIAGVTAGYLQEYMDPSEIGRKVDFKFKDTGLIPTDSKYTIDDFTTDVGRELAWHSGLQPIDLALGVEGILDAMFADGTSKFEYEGKAVVYGTYGGGTVDVEDKINSYHDDLAENGIVFVGSAQADIVNATDVASMLLGNEGADTITGGNGNDEIYGGTKSGADDGVVDSLSGGSGNDTYHVGLGDLVVEVIEEGTDLVQSSVTYTLGDNVEHLQLTGSDVINGTGNNQDNAIIGNSAANEIIGGDGEDVLIGGAGDDKLYGGGDGDTVDYLDGGAGADEFHVGEGDIVLNFNAGDKIYLNGVLLTGGENFRQWAYDDALDAEKVVLPFVDENGVAYTFVDTGFGEGGAMAVMTASMTNPVLIFGVELTDDTEADVRTVSSEEHGSWQSAGLVAEGGVMRFTRWDGIDHHIPELDPIPDIPGYAMDLYDWQVAGGVPGEFSEEEATWSIVDAAPERVILSGYDGFNQTWDQQLLLSTWSSGGTE